jgi:hypothetical protein
MVVSCVRQQQDQTGGYFGRCISVAREADPFLCQLFPSQVLAGTQKM